jgi:three-Cys-motif partner protein
MATRDDRSRSHRFGGTWTHRKLDILGRYLTAYTTALKGKPTAASPFRKAYIDAFAGTGYRDAKRMRELEGQGTLQLPDMVEDDAQGLLDGSARVALQSSPPFDRYIFIEKSAERCAELELLRDEFADKADTINIIEGEANEQIRALCAKDWRSHRAVLFLDPYGMQVEWKTIQAIAGTQAIDLWLLFPLGIGVNRLLTRSGEIPAGWRRRLDLLLGTDDWFGEFYKVERQPSLFGGDDEHLVKASTATIGKYFNQRLASIFAGVAEEPAVLRNSSGSPLYLLCFAVGNESGKEIALRIANHLMKEG